MRRKIHTIGLLLVCSNICWLIIVTSWTGSHEVLICRETGTGFIYSRYFSAAAAAAERCPRIKLTSESGYNRTAAEVKKHRIADACIIGARKTGTATIQQFMRINPKISSGIRETWFFDMDYNYIKGPVHYANKLTSAYDDQIILDTTPRYFITEAVPSRIKRVNPCMKLILSLRDPVVRLISEYTHNRFYGDKRRPEFQHSFDEMVFYQNGSINTTYPPLDSSIYIKYFRRWRQYFDMDQIYIVDGDRFVRDPISILNKIERFLDIPSVISSKDLVYSEKKKFYCLKEEDDVKCMGSYKGRKHPTISQQTLRKLYDFYEPYNKEFMEYTGLNFSWHMKQ